MGQPVAWKSGSHLAIIVKTNIEHLSVIGFNFIGGEFVIDHKLPVVRIQSKSHNIYKKSLMLVMWSVECFH